MSEYRQCNKCKENKLLTSTFFYRSNQKNANGFGYYCKECRKILDADLCKRRRRKCIDCGSSIHRYSKRCNPCHGINFRKENAPNWKGGRHKDRYGYVHVWKEGRDDGEAVNARCTRSDAPRYIKEHRLVMEKYLGRTLTKEENVHHKNGIRDDNRLENLELWNKTQPCGQRIEDKIIYALEILNLYKQEALEKKFRNSNNL